MPYPGAGPTRRARWAVLRAAGRFPRRLLAVPLTVTGQAPAAQPFVAVANHASIIDGLGLALCLPGPVCFAAADTFATQRLAGPFRRLIGCEFVHRAKPRQGSRRRYPPGRHAAKWSQPRDPARRCTRPWPRPASLLLRCIRHGRYERRPLVPVGIQGCRELLRPPHLATCVTPRGGRP
ncbi:MAG TPA: hypothetical protein DHU96_24815 [Actinobacteria bacterium]|nr:hypothetical protein [Actinomycetota bacterium]